MDILNSVAYYVGATMLRRKDASALHAVRDMLEELMTEITRGNKRFLLFVFIQSHQFHSDVVLFWCSPGVSASSSPAGILISLVIGVVVFVMFGAHAAADSRFSLSLKGPPGVNEYWHKKETRAVA
jgi:hypothetical protein